MEENQVFKCCGDCYSCLKENEIKRRNQWHYCAAQKAYDTMRMIEDMQKTLKSMNGTVEELKAKIEAIQNNEVCVYSTAKTEDAAQEGDGARVDPQDSIT